MKQEITQKQPPADVFQNNCSQKFRIIYRKTPVLKVNKLDLKETPTQVFSCEYCETF